MLKISTGSGENYGEKGSYESFKHLKEIGYNAVDYQTFCCEPATKIYTLNDKDFENFVKMDCAFAKEIGLEIIQTHGPWPFDDTKPELYASKFEAMIKSIKGTAIIGAKYVVMHPLMPSGWNSSPNNTEEVKQNIEYFKKLEPYAREYGVKIAIENMPGLSTRCTSVKELADCVDAVDSEYFVACYDTGHGNCSGKRFNSKEKVGDAIRLLGNRLGCLHIHDNDGLDDQHMLPFNGTIDWEDFIRALREIKYQGTINFECCAHNFPQKIKSDMEKIYFETAKYFATKVDE